jgi:hypothetical protein
LGIEALAYEKNNKKQPQDMSSNCTKPNCNASWESTRNSQEMHAGRWRRLTNLFDADVLAVATMIVG